MSNLFTIFASFFAAWAVLRYIILIEIRIDENTFKILYDLSKTNKKILLEEEFTHEKKYPVTYSAFCFYKHWPFFYVTHDERLMQAGWNAKDFVSKVILLRSSYKKFKKHLIDCHKKNTTISVDLLMPYSSDKIGHIKNKDYNPIFLNKLCESFEKEVADKIKTSAILYGNPGCGKTTFVKYLATKYNLPIKIVTFSPEFTNHDLLVLFSQIPDDCIVLLEDFDNYFHGRKCIIGEDNKNIKFTFDIILNALDGVYNNYENVIFIMTTNDLSKIDGSLKNRPSRFKYVIEFPNPDFEYINELFNNKEFAERIVGMNMDQVLTIKQYLDMGIDFENAFGRIGQ
jgi:hypothetical protein